MTLKELRISKSLTQQEASKISEVPLRTYKRIENDDNYQKTQKYQYTYKKIEEYVSKDKEEKSSISNVLVIGAGYVGLSISVILSRYINVDVIDIDEQKVEKINQRTPTFKDTEMVDLLKKKLHLKAFLPDAQLYKNRDVIIIAIPTDYDQYTGLLDTSGITNIVNDIRKVDKEVLIVIKSTCYIGYTESLKDMNVVYSPEFLREGKAIHDNLYPSRIIIGGDKSNKKVKDFTKLMQGITHNRARVLYMSYKEAEAVKMFSNSYLAMRVTYFNELDSYALSKDMNSKNIIEGISLDPRIGDFYNNPSFAFGGYCLPKDCKSLTTQINDIDDEGVIASIHRSNQNRKEYIANDILKLLKDKDNPVVGVYSLNAKKDGDNKRGAAILDVISILKSNGIKVMYFNKEEMSLDSFKEKVDLILTNRYDSSLDDIKEKVYTRDIFRRD